MRQTRSRTKALNLPADVPELEVWPNDLINCAQQRQNISAIEDAKTICCWFEILRFLPLITICYCCGIRIRGFHAAIESNFIETIHKFSVSHEPNAVASRFADAANGEHWINEIVKRVSLREFIDSFFWPWHGISILLAFNLNFVYWPLKTFDWLLWQMFSSRQCHDWNQRREKYCIVRSFASPHMNFLSCNMDGTVFVRTSTCTQLHAQKNKHKHAHAYAQMQSE